jgi:hypothetical protein
MADKTIATLDTELVTVGANDLIGVWDVAAGQYKKAKKSNVVGATITGGGVLATGGFTLTVVASGRAALTPAGGTWTPALAPSAGAPVYVAQVGRYLVLSDGSVKFCIASFNMLLSSKGTMNGNLGMVLPVAAANVVNMPTQVPVAITYYTGGGYVIAYVNPNTSNASLLKVGLNADSAFVTTADIGNTPNISGTIVYPCQ